VRWAPLLILCACGTPAAPRAAEPRARAEDPWKALDPRGDDWQAKLATIPAQDRQLMAIALLEEEDFQCTSVSVQDGCGPSELRFVSVLPSDGLDAPCLRRELARWAIEQIDAATLWGSMRKQANQLLRLPEPERELNVAAFDLLVALDDGVLQVETIDALTQAGSWVEASSLGDLSRASLQALGCKGVDAAVNMLIDQGGLVADDLQGFAASGDCEGVQQLEWPTQLRLLDELYRLRSSGVTSRGMEHLYTQILIGRSCLALGTLQSQYPDKPIPSARAEPWPYRTCVALAASNAQDVRDLVTSGDLTVRVTLDDVGDDREDRHATDLVRNDSTFAMPFADELLQALPGCETTTCSIPNTAIAFHLTYDKRGLLSELERIETVGGCH
jgi:hypothetical protein